MDGQLPQAHAGDAAAADAADAPVVDLLLAALDATLEQEGLGCEPCHVLVSCCDSNQLTSACILVHTHLSAAIACSKLVLR